MVAKLYACFAIFNITIPVSCLQEKIEFMNMYQNSFKVNKVLFDKLMNILTV